MLTLFYALGTCSLATHIALEEAGADYEAKLLRLSEREHLKPEYQAINPKGRVPALVTDRGVLTENVAILAWTAQTYPAARLAPLDDAFAFAQAQAFNAYLAATVHVAHAHGMRGSRWADDPTALADMKRKMPHHALQCHQLIEDELLKGTWVLGEDYSICDAYLFAISGWLARDGVETATLPRILAHRERMKERPAVQRVLARERAAAAA